jgi:hypothetical protein
LRADSVQNWRLALFWRILLIFGVAINFILLDHAQQAIDLIIDAIDVAHFDLESLSLCILSFVLGEVGVVVETHITK